MLATGRVTDIDINLDDALAGARKQVQDLYDRGLFLQAFRAAEQAAPLAEWRGADNRLMIARLMPHLGDRRGGELAIIRLHREFPNHPEICWQYGFYLMSRRGLWPALGFLRQHDDFPEAGLEARANWVSLQASVLGRFRDFDRAEALLAKAFTLQPDSPWLFIERACLDSLEDRNDEALAAAQKALAIRPWYRAAVQWLAHFLVQKERDQEALDLLTEASTRMESSSIAAQLASLQMELKQYDAARLNIERSAELAPRADKDFRQWLAAGRADVAYHAGDYPQARAQAKLVKGKFFEEFAARLENPDPAGKRVVLPVGFVRQHQDTCVPATLAAICRFWSMPGDHLEMAATLTYAGTPNHSERQWALDHGWHVREFTVNWDAARALIDRRVPFTLTTPEATNSHLQAVIGYDSVRGLLILRDPNERAYREALAQPFLERYRAFGPRGVALVPLAQRDLIDDLPLPNTALYDINFEFDKALAAHQRDQAEQACQKLEAQAPGHFLTLHARRTLAIYDADTIQVGSPGTELEFAL